MRRKLGTSLPIMASKVGTVSMTVIAFSSSTSASLSLSPMSLRVGDEQGRPDEIGDPDLLHREIEGERGALEHHVLGADAVDLIGRAQEMANVALA